MADEKKSNVQQLRDRAGNLPAKEILSEGIEKLRTIERRLGEEKGTYMKKCKVIRDDQSEMLEDLRGRGVDTKALTAYYKKVRLNEKAEELRNKLNEESQPIFDHIEEQLTFDLGEAADDKAPKKKPADAG